MTRSETGRAPSVAALCDEADAADRRRAQELARNLKLNITTAARQSEVEYLLGFAGGQLELRETGAKPGRGVSVDFSMLDLRRGSGNLSKRQPLARAIGPGAKTIVDATAGLGHDSLLLAAMGFDVLAIERSPIVLALLEDGLERALAAPAIRSAIDQRLNVLQGDARELLPVMRKKPDVVYIDPMFPPKRKASALAKKSIRFVRAIVGDDPDASELVQIARENALRRVVVKRPTAAEPLAPKPTMSHAGKLVRYDVYVVRGD